MLNLLRALRRITDFREFIILIVILAAALGMHIASPIFLQAGNIHSILLSLSLESIVAIGMTILLVSGGFDLSVGSNLALSGMIVALALARGIPVPAAIAAGLATGTAVGVLNGLIIAKIGINPFITTLGMMSVLRGLVLVISGGQNISPLPHSFNLIGQGKIAGVQAPILLAILLVVAGDLLLRKHRFFRQNYYIGGNPRAALLSGIPVARVTVINYALIGALAAVAGIVMTARLGAASITAGNGLELRVISAVIIGGASLHGGEGTVLGSFLGVLLMALIVNALTLFNVDVYWNSLVIGATLLLAVLLDTLARKRSL
jgi:ribose transport system permease protein